MATAPASSAPITLPPLPWPENALDPVISANTISFHYGKHHKTYVDNVNKMIAGTEYADMPLEKIVSGTAGKADKVGIFNNAAQAWNHTFYWNSLRGKGGGEPPSVLKQKIESAFASVDACKKELSAAAVSQFGSLVGAGRRQTQNRQDCQCGNADHARAEASGHNRCMGACLLSRLPEQACGSCECRAG